MGNPTMSRPGRLRERLRLTHVHERSDARLRERWQRRLDRGEEVHCWHCRLLGLTTPIDPQHWHLRDETRAPECAACHAAQHAVTHRDRC